MSEGAGMRASNQFKLGLEGGWGGGGVGGWVGWGWGGGGGGGGGGHT